MLLNRLHRGVHGMDEGVDRQAVRRQRDALAEALRRAEGLFDACKCIPHEYKHTIYTPTVRAALGEIEREKGD